MMLSCPHCGGQLQATSRIYWSMVDGQWVANDFSDSMLDFYCENDHEELDVDRDTYLDLAGAINRLERLVAGDDIDLVMQRQGMAGDVEDVDFASEILAKGAHVVVVHDVPTSGHPITAFVGPVLNDDASVIEFLATHPKAHIEQMWSLPFIRAYLEQEASC